MHRLMHVRAHADQEYLDIVVLHRAKRSARSLDPPFNAKTSDTRKRIQVDADVVTQTEAFTMRPRSTWVREQTCVLNAYSMRSRAVKQGRPPRKGGKQKGDEIYSTNHEVIEVINSFELPRPLLTRPGPISPLESSTITVSPGRL